MKYSIFERQEAIESLKKDKFDVVVIGGGITGAAILRDCALRGLKTALVEKGDFASGTSSKSSKLVHGGLRYLEQFNLKLVFEATHERARLLKLARSIVHPLPFIFPVFAGDRRGLGIIDAGLWLYELLSAFRCYRVHKRLNHLTLLKHEPMLRSDGLKGGVLYYDAITDDARLTLENIISGYQNGGVALNYMEVVSINFSEGKVASLALLDKLSGKDVEIKTDSVICAVGPWTEGFTRKLGIRSIKMRPTKGAHIVLKKEKLPISHAIVMSSPIDGRVMFAIPWNGVTVIGTTDTDYPNSADDVVPDKSDCEYLLTAVCHYFPSAGISTEDILGSWAGVRPLIDEGSIHTSDVSREHKVTVDPRGIVIIAGGKLTTYRLMAKEAVDALAPFLRRSSFGHSKTERLPLPSTVGAPDDEQIPQKIEDMAKRWEISKGSARHILMVYGSQADQVLNQSSNDNDLLKPLSDDLPYIKAEIAWACTHEMACTLEDSLMRRTPLFYLLGSECDKVFEETADVMSKILRWDEKKKTEELAKVRKNHDLHMACVK